MEFSIELITSPIYSRVVSKNRCTCTFFQRYFRAKTFKKLSIGLSLEVKLAFEKRLTVGPSAKVSCTFAIFFEKFI